MSAAKHAKEVEDKKTRLATTKRKREEELSAYAEHDSEASAKRVQSAVAAGLKAVSRHRVSTSQSQKTSGEDPTISCLRGNIGAGTTGEIFGNSNFASAGVPWAQLVSGKW